MAPLAQQAAHALLQVQRDAPTAMGAREQLGHGPGNRASHRAIGDLEHVHLHALGGGDRGEFEADETGPDDDRVAHRGQARSKRIRIGEGAQTEDPGETRARDVGNAVAGAGRDHQVVIGQLGARGQANLMTGAIDRHDAIVQSPDPMLVEVLHGAEA